MKRQLQLLTIGLLLAAGGVNYAWAGDFIDDATTIKVADTETSATSGDKKTLTFTPTSEETAIEFTFSSGKDITPGQIFGVVEYSGTGSNTDKCRFRNFTIGGTELEEGTKANQLSFTVNGNTVVLCPFLQNDVNNAAKVLKTYYKTNVDATSLSLTYCRMYVGATASTAVTFNRIGIYTLGEILTLYPDLKTNNFQISDSYRLTNDASTATNNASSKTNDGSTTGIIETKDASISTLAGCKLFCKAIDFAKLPDNYRYFWFRYLIPTDEAAHEDLFSGINSNAVLMLNLQNHASAYLPTLHTRVIDFDRKMQNTTFVDGVAPESAITVDGKNMGKTETANWGTYSRSLKAGYNSCAMPFKKFASTSDIPAGLSFYKVASINGSGVVSFTKMSDSDLTASTAFTDGSTWNPVIIKAETAGVYTFVGRDAITSWGEITYKAKTVGGSNNKVFWVGSFVNEVPTGDYASTTNYGITTDGASFAQMGDGVKTTYYRAFLADNRAGSSARALTLSFGDETTGIQNAMSESQQTDEVYDLQGRLVKTPTKGIYVKNGKKMIIK